MLDNANPTTTEEPGATRNGVTADETVYVDAIREALHAELTADPTVYLMGQDIGAYGGAFKITRGFIEEFGGERCFNTPISEAGTIGIAVGSAMLGRRPVVEMQFADFVSCGFNQLVNVAAKMYYRMQIPVPLVIRLPGGGGVGAGAFHSQNNEAWFTHVPGLKVVAPSTAEDAYTLLRAAIQDPNPVLYFEHKFLYRREKGTLPIDAPVPSLEHGECRVRREGSDITLVAWGWMVQLALEAADALEAKGISAEVIDVRTLVPLDEETIVESVRKTSRVVIVQEATQTSGFAAEIAARVADRAIDRLDAPIRRVTYPDHPVPFHKILEKAALPSVEKIVAEAESVCSW